MEQINNNSYYRFLFKLFDFAKQEWDKPFSETEDIDLSKVVDNTFLFMLLKSKFNGKPKVVSDKDYKKLESQEFYRGATEYEHTAELLADEEYRPAKGYMGGYFASTSFSLASEFTGGFNDDSTNSDKKVLSFKMPNGNGVKLSSLNAYLDAVLNGTEAEASPEINNWLAILNNFINKIPEIGNQQRFFKLFKNDPSKLAIYLGFDYILDDIKSHTNMKNVILLNRSKVTVSKSEFEKFVSRSSYRNLLDPKTFN